MLNGSTDPLRPTDSVKIGFAFQNLQFMIIYGNVRYISFISQAANIPIGLFTTNFGGNISFVNPSIDINVNNSFGIPINILLSNINAISAKNNSITNIAFPPPYNPISINYPSFSEIGKSKNTIISFDSIHPSMVNIISTNPSAFNFTADGYSDTTNLKQTNFLADTSHFKATIEVDLPMWFRAGDFSLQDTIGFDFSKISGGDLSVQLAMIRLAVNNGLPIDVKMQVYFADSLYHVIDSMFVSNLSQIPAAAVDNVTSKVTAPTSNVSDVTLDNAKVLKIKNTKWALVKASLTTAQYLQNPGLKVKIFSSYKLGFNLYFKVQLKITKS